MWLNSTAQTALRAVTYLGRFAPGTLIPVTDVAAAIGRPANYLSKILNALRRAGVLTANRGPSGGFGLARPAEAITLGEVIGPFAPLDSRRCLLGGEQCGETTACVAHAEWSRVAHQVEQFVNHTTVAALVAREAGLHP